MYYVYVLQSKRTGRRYTGSAADVADRLERHNGGRSKATKSGRPWQLIHTESFDTRAEAVRRETYLKTGVGREKLDATLG